MPKLIRSITDLLDKKKVLLAKIGKTILRKLNV